MRIIVAAVGRLKRGPETELSERYRKRAAQTGRQLGLRDIEIIEIRESRAGDAGRRMIEESIALANVIPQEAAVVLLDSRGQNIESAGLAGLLTKWRANGRSTVIFVIGGCHCAGFCPSSSQNREITQSPNLYEKRIDRVSPNKQSARPVVWLRDVRITSPHCDFRNLLCDADSSSAEAPKEMAANVSGAEKRRPRGHQWRYSRNDHLRQGRRRTVACASR